MSKTKQTAKIEIHAKVFRIGTKPRIFPDKIWKWLADKRVPGTGRWEDHGIITRENASITN